MELVEHRLWKNKTINLTIIFNPYYYRKKLALLLLSLLTLLHLYVLQNTKIKSSI